MKRRILAALALLLLCAAGACRGPALPPPPEAADFRRPAEQWLREESVRLLRDYVRLDTTNQTRGEKDGAEFLKDLQALRDLGKCA